MTNKIRNLPEGFHWKVTWKDDENGDASWLGDFSRREPDDDFVVNRRTGQLLGPAAPQERIFSKTDAHFTNVWGDDGYWADTLHDSHDNEWEFIEETPEGLGKYSGYFRPVLREGLSTRYSRNEYEWWSTDNHGSTEEYGLEAVLDDIVADYERLAAYGSDWYFQGCTVSLMYGTEEIAEYSLWGIESDRTRDYEREVEEDLMWEALDPKELEELQFEAQATMLGAEQLGKPSAKAKKRYEAFTALLTLYPEILVERQAAYEAQQAAWKAEKGESL